MKSGLIENMNWRYATKKFDPSKKVPEHDMDELIEVLRLAPSSFGLQPLKFVVVTDADLRVKLREAAWGQPQITDSSHLIVLCARTDVDDDYIKNFVANIAKTRSISVESLKDYENMMLGFRKNKTESDILAWAEKQAYITLGVLLTACAEKKIDACPMEGFDKLQFDKILELGKQNLTSVVLCTVGYRADDDWLAKAKKVRLGKDDMFLFL